MTTPWRTFSIFISSTFADMQAERDHLKNVVFPLVEEELNKRRIRLEIVDLRWGVDTTSMEQEDEREASVLKVCLDEIRRCRPFFIGLLGDRYGWVPPEERMRSAVVGLGNIKAEKGKSVTALEIEFGVLASEEQLVRSVFYFREPLPYPTFPAGKAALFSDLHNPDLAPAEREARGKALEKLKNDIREHFIKQNLPGKVKTYEAAWDETKARVTKLAAWGNEVEADILAECESHAKETWDKAPKDWQEQEMALLDAFIEQHTHVATVVTDAGEERVPTFCGREKLLDELRLHLVSDDAAHWGLALTGESGSGKSAVFAMMHKMMEKEDCLILAHSAGLSPRAKSVADLLKIWNGQLKRFLGEKTSPPAPLLKERGEGENPTESPIEILQQQFAELLSMAAGKKRVVLLIDAIDRFEPTARARHLSWLPTLMPLNVRLLVTAITGREKNAVKYHEGLRARGIDVFSEEEATEMLAALCRRQHKSLPGAITRIILEKRGADGTPATASPLWLSLAVNLLMAIDQDDFEQMSKLEGRGDQQIETYLTNLAKAFDPLPGKLFLSLVEKAGLLFGSEFAQAVFKYIAVSRNGLREKDLEALLPAAGMEWDPLRFAMLRRWFKSHFIIQGEELQWNLGHSILDNTLLESLKESGRREMHRAVGSYLLSLPDDDGLKVSETMYHLMQADAKEMAAVYYGSYWWDAPQTEGSSKVMAEAVMTDEANGQGYWLDWLVSLLAWADKEPLNPRTVANNYLFSFFDFHFQNDIAIGSQIRLVQSTEARMKELRRRAPDSADYARDLSISFERLGDLYLQLGDPPKALDKYQASLAIREELRRRAPDSADYARDLSTSYHRIGDIYLQLGDFNKSMENHQSSLKIIENLKYSGSYSYDTDFRISIYTSRVGDLYLKLGDLTNAFEKFYSALQICEKLLNIDPQSVDANHGIVSYNQKLGEIYIHFGDSNKALERYLESLKVIEKIHQQFPESIKFARELWFIYSKIGDIQEKIDNSYLALEFRKKGLSIIKNICQKVSDSVDHARDLSISYEHLGNSYLRLGKSQIALKSYFKSLIIRKNLLEIYPESAQANMDLIVIYSRISKVYLKKLKFRKAFKFYNLGVKRSEYLIKNKMIIDNNPTNKRIKSYNNSLVK